MSLLIKGMDLPKSEEYIPMRIYGNGHIWVNGAYKGVAIQIPTPHGRLVDADKIFTYGHWEEQAVNEAPTILEAEE